MRLSGWSSDGCSSDLPTGPFAREFPHPVVVKGTHEQKARWVPRLIAGQDQVAFGFTEPDAGLNTTRIKTFAEKVPGGYVVHGQKVWTSTAQVANKIMLLPRPTKFEDCTRPSDGITIFDKIGRYCSRERVGQ